MAKQNKNLYNKKSIGQAIKVCLDTIDAKILYPDTNYRPVSSSLCESIAQVIIKNIQKAIVNGQKVYFPEIGSLKTAKVNPGRQVFCFKTGTHKPVKDSKYKVKFIMSESISNLINNNQK